MLENLRDSKSASSSVVGCRSKSSWPFQLNVQPAANEASRSSQPRTEAKPVMISDKATVTKGNAKPSLAPDSAWIRFLTSARIRWANLLLPTIAAASTGSVATNVAPTSNESLNLSPMLWKTAQTISDKISHPYTMAPKRTRFRDLAWSSIYLGGSSAPVANSWITRINLESSKVSSSTLLVHLDGLNQSNA
ncbi:hypothetical protein OGAPHI_000258 [Ogataea philodendri]|uniref:Uncharacterized protein n=1 Tax=Ogataea philodendri TaxID=1378263 RepID=A0A9P8TAP4_9ASCO|nr:uncharacterized protein OGAPHI_000258 [Ogataea philodendri]KAH3671555.1 hypothetical protein OGAPHI_000258 [Ogataea philodendri]